MLVLLPTSTQKLYAQWQGPYQIVKHQLFQVNMLFVSPPACMYMSEVQDGEVDDEVQKIPQSRHNPHLGTAQLTTESRNCSIVGGVLRYFFSGRGPGRQT